MNPNIIEGPEEYKKLISEVSSDTPLDEIDYGDKAVHEIVERLKNEEL